MSKQRMVNTRFWTDGYILRLTKDEKLIFIYLLTNQRSELCGAYELPLDVISFETGVDKESVLKALESFARDSKVIRDGDWVYMVNFSKHQAVNPNVQKGIDRSLEDLPLGLAEKIKAFKSLPNHSESLANHSSLRLRLRLEPELRPIGERRATFVAPTPQEVKDYCQERGNQIDPQRFVDFYASKGWMVGKNKMRDWKASVRGWEAREGKRGFPPARKTNVTII